MNQKTLTGTGIIAALVIGYAMPQTAQALDCGAGQQQVTHHILIDDHANDLKKIALYNPETGQNETLVPGGEGNLTKIQSVWNAGDETTGFFEYNLNTGTMTSTSEAAYIGRTGQEHTITNCQDLIANSNTIFGVYENTGNTTGLRAGVGLIENATTNTVVNAATDTWFAAFNEGLDRSGAQIINNIITLHKNTGDTEPLTNKNPDRKLAEKLVIGLNEIYAKQLINGQLQAVGEGIDTRGTTIYIEDKNNNNLCLGQETTRFSINGKQQTINQGCTGNIATYEPAIGIQETSIGKTYTAETTKGKTTGTIQDGELGTTNATCNNNTLIINYSGNPHNTKTTIEQNGTKKTLMGNNIETTVNGCTGITITSAPQGNKEPLYERTTEINNTQTFKFVGLSQDDNQTAEFFDADQDGILDGPGFNINCNSVKPKKLWIIMDPPIGEKTYSFSENPVSDPAGWDIIPPNLVQYDAICADAGTTVSPEIIASDGVNQKNLTVRYNVTN